MSTHFGHANAFPQNSKPKAVYEKLLTDPLRCFYCDGNFSTMPKLKEHLEDEFKKQKNKAVHVAKTGIKRRNEEETENDLPNVAEIEDDVTIAHKKPKMA